MMLQGKVITHIIREKLVAAGQTQDWLARRVGVSERTFTRRNRDGRWTLPELRKIFRELGFTEQEILLVMKGGRHEI